MQRWQLIIKGKVQGVFYRKSTAEQAQQLGVTGFVRNLDNGDVEVIAEGSQAQLQSLRAWCRHGPKSARVDDINLKVLAPSDEFSAFEVRH